MCATKVSSTDNLRLDALSGPFALLLELHVRVLKANLGAVDGLAHTSGQTRGVDHHPHLESLDDGREGQVLLGEQRVLPHGEGARQIAIGCRI